MQKTLVKLLATLGLVAVALVSTPTKAEAAFTAWICSNQFCAGGDVFIVTDNGAGDADATVGSIVATHATGGLTTTVNIGTSKPVLAQPSMDLGFVASGIGTAYLYTSDTDFTNVTNLHGTIDGNFSGTGSVQGFLYGGDNNVLGTLSNGVSTPLLNSSPFSGTLNKLAASTSPYAMTLGVTIVRTTGGITTGDFLVTPEPATMGLFGLALFGLGGAVRRRFSL